MKWPLGVLQARAISSMMSLLDLQYLSTGVAQSTQTNCTVVEPWVRRFDRTDAVQYADPFRNSTRTAQTHAICSRRP